MSEWLQFPQSAIPTLANLHSRSQWHQIAKARIKLRSRNMVEYTRTPDISTTEGRVIAFFRNKDDAYSAVTRLKDAGFDSSQIGLMSSENRTGAGVSAQEVRDRESMWEKLKNFFTGPSLEDEDIDYRDSASAMSWDQNRADYYYRGITEGGALVSVVGPRSEEARSILQAAGGELRETGFEQVAARSGTGVSPAAEDYRIQLRGEILRTYKERVQRGEVRLRKEVVTEQRTVEVPVSREELVVENVPVSGEQQPAGEIGSDQEIRVPLSEERVRVEKKPVVTEEVRVGKRAAQDTQRVSDDVRHEELHVDKEGDADVQSDQLRTGKRKKPAA
jgi:uncharacterized protein (TIGR02271 family)